MSPLLLCQRHCDALIRILVPSQANLHDLTARRRICYHTRCSLNKKTAIMRNEKKEKEEEKKKKKEERELNRRMMKHKVIFSIIETEQRASVVENLEYISIACVSIICVLRPRETEGKRRERDREKIDREKKIIKKPKTHQ